MGITINDEQQDKNLFSWRCCARLAPQSCCEDCDWVVVGATPDDLLSQGYQQVGKDFPVFLHPQTKEEYALARTERKAGSGYTGFICDFSPTISLEQDLSRRDLTINALAQDSTEKSMIFMVVLRI